MTLTAHSSFQVATRRTRTAGKVEIPNVDDHVSKLEHMGKETVKKLQDIRTAAVQASVEINVPVNCILKGAFIQYLDSCYQKGYEGLQATKTLFEWPY